MKWTCISLEEMFKYACRLWRMECFSTAESSSPSPLQILHFLGTYEHLTEWCSVMASAPVSYLEFVCLNLDFESVLELFPHSLLSTQILEWCLTMDQKGVINSVFRVKTTWSVELSWHTHTDTDLPTYLPFQLTVCSISDDGFISKTGIAGDIKGVRCGII